MSALAGALLSAGCFYQPHGSVGDADGTTAGTSGGGEPTTGDGETSADCNQNGQCDPEEDALRCPAECPTPAVCGDGVPGSDETCDDGADNGMYGHCNVECSDTIRCGDGVTSHAEVCDDGPGNGDEYAAAKHCRADCGGYAPHCGDDLC